MTSDIDPAIAELVRIAIDELGADFTIIQTRRDAEGLCAALRGPDGREHSVCIDWQPDDGQIAAIDQFQDQIKRLTP